MRQRRRKEACILIVVRGDKILLESVHHSEGYEILSVPGAPRDALPKRIADILGGQYVGAEKSFGSFTDLIIKPAGETELTGECFRVEMRKNDPVSIPKEFGWYTREEIETDPRCRRDRRFYLRLLEPKPFNLKYSENQRGRWIDATILSWDEK